MGGSVNCHPWKEHVKTFSGTLLFLYRDSFSTPIYLRELHLTVNGSRRHLNPSFSAWYKSINVEHADQIISRYLNRMGG